MSKNSKVILSILFVGLFISVGWCAYQINQTQQAFAFLAERLTSEVSAESSGTSDAGSAEETPSSAAPSRSIEERLDSIFGRDSEGTKTPAADTAEGQTVYWVPNGKVWHTTPDCSTLSRSSDIRSGTIEESGKSRVCEKCG